LLHCLCARYCRRYARPPPMSTRCLLRDGMKH
jgi:hypothetical protein